MSNILEVNNNALREAKYTLTIVDGEQAEVYIESTRYPDLFIENLSINDYGYWKDFLQTTDSITLPLIGIGAMTKNQSIWYRNQSVVDSTTVQVSNDYNNNIIEFLNRGVKNADLDFDNIEQLLFIINVNFINSVGNVTKKPIFVGRPEITKDDTTNLLFKVKSMDSILDDAPFDTSVLEESQGSFYNFIDLKQAFENIFNTPHRSNDEYSYPCVPFDLNSEMYLPNDPYSFHEVGHLLDSDVAYAEDTILGDETGRMDTFYYRQSPECGIATFNVNNPKDVSYSNLSTWRMFSNQDEIDDGSRREVRQSHKNAFRMFRPIRTFIAPSTNNEMSVGYANDDPNYYVLTRPADTNDFRITEGDEIVVCEHCMDIGMINDDGKIKPSVVVLFNESVNIYYYNKTKDIFYWNVIIQGASSIPLPSQWYDMVTYIDVDSCDRVRYDINYQVYEDYSGEIDKLNNYKYLTYTNNMFSEWMYQTNHHIRRDNNMDTSVSGGSRGAPLISNMLPADLLAGWVEDEDGTTAVPRYVENSRTDMEAVLTKIYSRCNPKSVVLDEDFNIIWGYGNSYSSYSYANNVNGITTTRIKNVFNLTNTVNYSEDKRFSGHEAQPHHYLYEISTNFGDRQATLGLNTYWLNGVPYNYLDTIVTNIMGKPYNTFDPSLDNFFRPQNICNLNVYEDYVYLILNEGNAGNQALIMKADEDGEYAYDGIYWTVFKYYEFRDVTLLDINIGLDRTILIDHDDNNTLKYEGISDEVDYNSVSITSTSEYLLSMNRDRCAFTDVDGNEKYIYIDGEVNAPIRLLGYGGDRLQANVGVSNSFFKNSYNDNYGVKKIGFDQPTSIVLTDDEMFNIDVKTVNYNKLEYDTFNREKNGFSDLNNDEATTKELDDTTYDEALTVNIYSNVDINMSVSLKRTATGIDWSVTNTFGNVTGDITPSSYSAFEIPLTGIFDGIIIYVNFFDTELELNKTFGGLIERSKLVTNSVKDEVVSLDKKFVWKNDKTLGLKFPFLYNKYSEYFNLEMKNYWTENQQIRKLLIATVTVNELLLFNDNYGIMNIGEQRILIDSDKKYLNGYGFYHGSLLPFNDNRASFFIEKMIYDFENKKTILTLVSI